MRKLLSDRSFGYILHLELHFVLAMCILDTHLQVPSRCRTPTLVDHVKGSCF